MTQPVLRGINLGFAVLSSQLGGSPTKSQGSRPKIRLQARSLSSASPPHQQPQTDLRSAKRGYRHFAWMAKKISFGRVGNRTQDLSQYSEVCEANALPTELHALNVMWRLADRGHRGRAGNRTQDLSHTEEYAKRTLYQLSHTPDCLFVEGTGGSSALRRLCCARGLQSR
jgi:hypothetical protein